MQRYPSTHSAQLARLADHDDAVAWFSFCARYGRLILGVARRHGLQHADCEDVLQESMLELARSLPRFTYDRARGRFRGYLRRIVLRVIHRKLRQHYEEARQYTNGGALETLPAESEVIWQSEWRAHHVRRALQSIEDEFSEVNRMAFIACTVHNRSAAEVAAALGISTDQVYQARSRITRRLTEVLARQVREEE